MAFREIFEITRVRFFLFLREPEAVFWVFVVPIAMAVVLGWAFASKSPDAETVGLLKGESTTELEARIESLIPATREDVANKTHRGTSGTARETADLPPPDPEGESLLRLRLFRDAEEAERALRHGKIAILIRDGGRTVEYDPARDESEIARLRLDERLGDPSRSRPFAFRSTEARGARYVDWLFPGLIGMNLMSTGIWSIGFCMAEWRQKKLLRRFLVTPMRRSSLLLGFVFARFTYLILEVALLGLFGVLVLGVPLAGSILSFFAISLLGGLAFSGVGILVAARPRTVEGVSGLMNLVMMPLWLFGGIFFSYERFPESIHGLIRLLPIAALNDSLRAIMLEGESILALWSPIAVMMAWTIGCFAIALRVFRWE